MCCTAERLDGRAKRRHRRAIDDLPDGAFVALEEGAFAVRGGLLLQWTPSGYAARKRRLRGGTVDVLTPPAILAVLAAGYRPQWHPSGHFSTSRPPCLRPLDATKFVFGDRELTLAAAACVRVLAWRRRCRARRRACRGRAAAARVPGPGPVRDLSLGAQPAARHRHLPGADPRHPAGRSRAVHPVGARRHAAAARTVQPARRQPVQFRHRIRVRARAARLRGAQLAGNSSAT